MIKAEVVFKGDVIHIKDCMICLDGVMWDIYIHKEYKDSFIKLERAVAYCLEQSK